MFYGSAFYYNRNSAVATAPANLSSFFKRELRPRKFRGAAGSQPQRPARRVAVPRKVLNGSQRSVTEIGGQGFAEHGVVSRDFGGAADYNLGAGRQRTGAGLAAPLRPHRTLPDC